MSAGAASLHARARWTRLLWPGLALLLMLLCWSFALIRLHDQRRAVERVASEDASLYAHAYEQYVTRSIAQMDQVAMQLVQSWEQSGGKLNLQQLYRSGMFTDSAYISVSIADPDGRVRNATRGHAMPVDMHNAESFLYHKNNNSTAMGISVPQDEAGPPHHAIAFTRRLDAADESFAGVLVLTIDASYFTDFYNERALGQHGFVAVSGTDSPLRLERRGPGLPAAANDALLVNQPRLRQMDDVRWMGPAMFSDQRARLLSWHRSSAYPIMVYVGMSRQELMQTVDTARNESILNCVVVAAALLLLGLWGYWSSSRTFIRQLDEDEVRRAYRTATESANDGFYMASALRGPGDRIVDFEITDCNERGAKFYGMARSELVGRRVLSLPVTVVGEELLPTYTAAMVAGFYEDERLLPLPDCPAPRWVHRRLVRVGKGLAITLHDISARKIHEHELARLANEDALTRLPNRYWLNRFLPGALVDAAEHGSSLALLFIDLDDFKHVNDTQGHVTGDLLLGEAATRLKSLMREGDYVVRFGGDEFIVLLSPVGGDAQIIAVAQRILRAIAAPFSIGDDKQTVGASIGISVFPRDGTDPESLIRHGDIAMYSGKSEGKGQYRFFDPALFARLKSRARLKHDLQRALEQDELQLHYQPRVDPQTGELCSMEALVRWVHPQLGLIPPLDFIPLAESSGLILRLGEIVMEQACRQLATWRDQGLPLVPVSINVSPKQFTHGNVHHQLALQLARFQIDARLLEVEITESAMMGDQDDIIAELTAMRALGIKLHVDDFGTGYSSLSQLQKLKMDVLKVDRAFTQQLDNSKEGRIFFQAIVSMAHALGMAVVAEGVETAGQLAILQQMQCNEIQGYYIARPMPAAQMAAYLERRFLLPSAGQ